MGSGEAKKFRAMYGSAGRHGESFWSDERENIGMKLLKGMGWETGQGLGKAGQGSTAHIRQTRKSDNAGIGASKATRDETYRASQDLFNGILARLSGGGGDAEEPELGAEASTVKGAIAKRQLANRFRRAKDTASCNSKDLNEILGRSAGDDRGPDADGDVKMSSADGQHTSGVSVNEYFLRRRRELGLASSSAPLASNPGFTLDDQASFAEQQLAQSYSGRFGLGHSACGAQPTPDRTSFEYAPPAAWAPPSKGSTEAAGAESGSMASGKEGGKEAKKAAKEARKAAKAAAKEQRREERAAKKAAKEEKRAAKAARKAAMDAAAAAAAAGGGDDDDEADLFGSDGDEPAESAKPPQEPPEGASGGGRLVKRRKIAGEEEPTEDDGDAEADLFGDDGDDAAADDAMADAPAEAGESAPRKRKTVIDDDEDD